MSGATVIIGAGQGLGASLARRFARAGDRLVLAARDPSGLEELAKETAALGLPCDATREGDVKRLFEQIDEAGLSVSTLVYNAGAYSRGAIADLAPDDVQRLMQVNAYGAFLVAQQAAKRMIELEQGAMLFTGASAGVKGYPNSAAFAMGKFALRGLCQSLARELAPLNIHVAHFVIDGLIHAPHRGGAYADREKCLDPDDIAETYFRIATQPRSAWTWEVELRPWTESF